MWFKKPYSRQKQEPGQVRSKKSPRQEDHTLKIVESQISFFLNVYKWDGKAYV